MQTSRVHCMLTQVMENGSQPCSKVGKSNRNFPNSRVHGGNATVSMTCKSIQVRFGVHGTTGLINELIGAKVMGYFNWMQVLPNNYLCISST